VLSIPVAGCWGKSAAGNCEGYAIRIGLNFPGIVIAAAGSPRILFIFNFTCLFIQFCCLICLSIIYILAGSGRTAFIPKKEITISGFHHCRFLG
jgi:uncharacterized membrane protein YtjA (UPF0391 family)